MRGSNPRHERRVEGQLLLKGGMRLKCEPRVPMRDNRRSYGRTAWTPGAKVDFPRSWPIHPQARRTNLEFGGVGIICLILIRLQLISLKIDGRKKMRQNPPQAASKSLWLVSGPILNLVIHTHYVVTRHPHFFHSAVILSISFPACGLTFICRFSASKFAL